MSNTPAQPSSPSSLSRLSVILLSSPPLNTPYSTTFYPSLPVSMWSLLSKRRRKLPELLSSSSNSTSPVMSSLGRGNECKNKIKTTLATYLSQKAFIIMLIVMLFLPKLSMADPWSELSSKIKALIGNASCSDTLVSPMMDRIRWCHSNLNDDVDFFSKQEMKSGIGCCIMGKFVFCLEGKFKHDTSFSCQRIIPNVTDITVSELQVSTRTSCTQKRPAYPTSDCDVLMSGARSSSEFIGLAISASLFSLVILTIAYLILLVSHRSSVNGRRNHYQAL